MTSLIDHSDVPAVEHLIVLRPADSAAHAPSRPSAVPAHARTPAFAPLMLELMARAHRVAVVDDAPSVMVELHRGGQAVVLVDPPSTPVAAELISAVTRYYPRVSLWQAHADPHHDRPTLTRIVSAASVSAASQPHMLLDESHLEANTSHATEADMPRNAALVTDEELAMLMSPFDENAQR